MELSLQKEGSGSTAIIGRFVCLFNSCKLIGLGKAEGNDEPFMLLESIYEECDPYLEEPCRALDTSNELHFRIQGHMSFLFEAVEVRASYTTLEYSQSPLSNGIKCCFLESNLSISADDSFINTKGSHYADSKKMDFENIFPSAILLMAKMAIHLDPHNQTLVASINDASSQIRE